MRLSPAAVTACLLAGACTLSFDPSKIPPSNLVPQDGLVGWYRFEDDPADGVIDDSSPRGAYASCYGDECPTRSSGGNHYLFDGIDDNVRIADPFESDGSFTVALCAKLADAEIEPNFNPSFLEKSGAWNLYYTSGDVVFATEMGGDSQRTPASEAAPRNAWVHVAASFDGAIKRLYVGGQLANQDSIAYVDASDSIIGVGAALRDGAPQHLLHGAIDEVMLYERALTDTEVRAIAREPGCAE